MSKEVLFECFQKELLSILTCFAIGCPRILENKLIVSQVALPVFAEIRSSFARPLRTSQMHRSCLPFSLFLTHELFPVPLYYSYLPMR